MKSQFTSTYNRAASNDGLGVQSEYKKVDAITHFHLKERCIKALVTMNIEEVPLDSSRSIGHGARRYLLSVISPLESHIGTRWMPVRSIRWVMGQNRVNIQPPRLELHRSLACKTKLMMSVLMGFSLTVSQMITGMWPA